MYSNFVFTHHPRRIKIHCSISTFKSNFYTKTFSFKLYVNMQFYLSFLFHKNSKKEKLEIRNYFSDIVFQIQRNQNFRHYYKIVTTDLFAVLFPVNPLEGLIDYTHKFDIIPLQNFYFRFQFNNKFGRKFPESTTPKF